MARYLKVKWRHSHADEPIWLFSEVLDDREVRKVEIYRDGRMDHADERSATGSTILSESKFPELEEIAADPQFSPHAIAQEEFESVWQTAVQKVPGES